MLCLSGDAGYIHEPLHPWLAQSWMRVRPDRLYPYITDAGASRFGPEFDRILRFGFPLAARLREARSPGAVLAALATARQARRHARQRRVPLLKDPMALLAAPWLASTFGVLPVFVVRHPIGVVASAVSRRWMVDPVPWLDDEHLRRDLIEPWVSDIEAASRGDDVDRAAVAWKVMYGVVQAMASEHPDWPVVRYEDLVSDPAAAFARLYEQLGFTFTPIVGAAIVGGLQPGPAFGTGALPEEEARRVRAITADVAAQFYDSTTWSL